MPLDVTDALLEPAAPRDLDGPLGSARRGEVPGPGYRCRRRIRGSRGCALATRSRIDASGHTTGARLAARARRSAGVGATRADLPARATRASRARRSAGIGTRRADPPARAARASRARRSRRHWYHPSRSFPPALLAVPEPAWPPEPEAPALPVAPPVREPPPYPALEPPLYPAGRTRRTSKAKTRKRNDHLPCLGNGWISWASPDSDGSRQKDGLGMARGPVGERAPSIDKMTRQVLAYLNENVLDVYILKQRW